jgi:hypothetical protein
MAFIDSGKTFDKDGHHDKMKVRMENMDVSAYLLRIPAPLYKQVKMKLVKDEKTLREVLVCMLEEYIKE